MKARKAGTEDVLVKPLNPANRRSLLTALPWLVGLITCAAFLPSLQNDFVNLDDPNNFTDNQLYRGLGPAQLKWMFQSFQLGGVYQPLSWLTHSLEYVIWGLRPSGYHLTSLILHVLNAVLLYFVAHRVLSLSQRSSVNTSPLLLGFSAAVSALFFSLHPLRVEAVAWASNRSYVLPAFFYLASIWAYLKAHSSGNSLSPSKGWLALSVLIFAASLLSKAVGVALPFTLLAIDAVVLRRFHPREKRLQKWFEAGFEKIPYFALVVIMTAVSAWGRYKVGAIIPVEQFGWGARLGMAFFGLSFYLEKTIIPLNLAAIYSLPNHLHFLDKLVLARTLIVLCGASLLLFKRRAWPAVAATMLVYAVNLLPFLGLSQYGLLLQIAADKWCYIAAMPLALLAGGGVYWMFSSRAYPRSIAISIGIALFILGLLTWTQTKTWHDSETLYNHNLKVDPEAFLAHNNLASFLNSKKMHKEALVHAKECVRIRPSYVEGYLNAAVASFALDKAYDAIRYCEEAMQVNPRYALTYFNIGYFYAMLEKWDLAIANTKKALELDPNMKSAQGNLDYFLRASSTPEGFLEQSLFEYNKGNFEGSIAAAKKALELRPGYAEAYNNICAAYNQLGRWKEAVAAGEKAVALKPDFVLAQNNLRVAREKLKSQKTN